MPIPEVWDDVNYPDSYSIGSMTGGYSYKYYGDDGETNRKWYQLGSTVTKSMTGNIDPDRASGNEAFDLGTVITFPNGYTDHLKITVNYANTISFSFSHALYDENGTEISLPSISGVTFGQGGFGATQRGYLYGDPTIEFVLFLSMEYYPQTPINAEHPTGFSVHLFGANGLTEDMWRSGGVLLLDSWGSNANVNTYDNFGHAYSSNLERYITQPLLDNNYISFTPAGMKNFNDWLHERGNPFDGDAFTPEGGGGSGDPAGSDDPSVPGGGNGNYDDRSDPIDFPALPLGGALESGAVRAYLPSELTIKAVMQKLWNMSIFDIGNMWQKSLQNPMDAIVSLHCLPFAPDLNGPDEIIIGNLATGLSSTLISGEYKEIDCGTLTLKEYWGSALDYTPYTRIEIFLPFIGVKELLTEDCMKNTLHIKYYIDVLTGDCIAFIKCGISVLYHFTGNCKESIPLSANSMDLIQKGIAGTAAIVAGTAIGGGFGAAAGAVMSSAANVASSKVKTSRAGEVSGVKGIMDHFVPYLIIHRPAQSLAKDYNKFKGYTSNLTSQLGNLSGYTEVEHINLKVAGATAEELTEIKDLLQSGVII